MSWTCTIADSQMVITSDLLPGMVSLHPPWTNPLNSVKGEPNVSGISEASTIPITPAMDFPM